MGGGAGQGGGVKESVIDWYGGREYPAMSHPPSHPAVTGVAGRLAGLGPVDFGGMRVLELGCAGGWNLLPVAAAFPGAQCVGIDVSEPAVEMAREVAAEAGLDNVRFERADLAEWEEDGAFDFVIAHGVFSWVEDAVKRRLLDRCREWLAPEGLAYVGFNTLPGWSFRQPVVEMVRAMAGREGFGETSGAVLEEIFEALEGADSAHAALLRETVQDMRAKGGVLAFDDFAPVCDPVTVAQFVAWSAESGLRWLGEAEMSRAMPDGISKSGGELLDKAAGDRLLAEQLADVLSGRTHRNAVLARADARPPDRVSMQVVFDLCVRPLFGVAEVHGTMELLDRGGRVRARMTDRLARDWFAALAEVAPACVSVGEVLEGVGSRRGGDVSNDLPALARLILDSARAGLHELRTEPVAVAREVPERPRLDALRMAAARRGRPLVDAFHAPLSFPEAHYRVLQFIDGTKSAGELAALARAHAPKLDFPRWIAHLTERGIVV